MAVNSIVIARSPDEVFAALADGWAYTNWVVGTSHMRAVNANWPAVGAKLHHAAGAWPMLRRDETIVDEVEPGRRLVLTARGRPFGEAKIVIELTDAADGCRLTMTETPCAGPARWVHNPVNDAVLARRNVESLARLKALVERPTEPDGL